MFLRESLQGDSRIAYVGKSGKMMIVSIKLGNKAALEFDLPSLKLTAKAPEN